MRVWYEGIRKDTGCIILRHTENDVSAEISLRLDLWNHSPTGFGWGYGGSGPAQTALALLAHALHNDTLALELHQRFKWAVVAVMPHEGWQLTQQYILGWAKDALASKQR